MGLSLLLAERHLLRLGCLPTLGQFEVRESLSHYLLNIAGGASGFNLVPLDRIDGAPSPEEQILDTWPGFEGNGPVRVGVVPLCIRSDFGRALTGSLNC
jgi:hypothetical protein